MSVPSYTGSAVPVPEGFEPFPIEKTDHSVAELLQESYERHSARIAIDANGWKISYNELDRLTNQVAHRIIAQAGDKEGPVAILVEQGVSQIIAVLGVLKSGRVYSAMDLSNPPERLAGMLADLGACLVVSNSNNSTLARSLVDGSVPVVEMDKLNGGDGKILVARSADDLAGVCFTSGSSGRPKGVVHTHRGLLHWVGTSINRYCMNPDDKLPFPFSCSYAGSVSSMFATLLCGGTLYPIDLKSMSMQGLAAFMEEKQITIFVLSTSILRSLVSVLDNSRRHFPRLKILVVGAELIQTQDVRLWQSLISPQTILGCLFASSEAAIITFNTIYPDVELSQGILPVGFPLPQKEILIVDEERRPLPQGQTGEIAIRSEYLAHGYWNKPDLTNAVFQNDPHDPSKRIFYSSDLGRILPNGMLEHLGRKDSYAKIRAYSVDLLEVEQAIYDLQDVKHVVVQALPARHDPDQKQLVAYLVVGAQHARNSVQMRKALAGKLPAYMIPSHFVFLDEMPLNLNGKVDKKALPPVDHTRELDAAELPADDIEKRLALIWQDVLKQKDIGVNDGFFDLGGDSLLAMHLLMMIEKDFSQRMPLAVISKASSIREQADLMRSGSIADYASVLIPIQTKGSKDPVFCIGGKGGNPIRFHRLVHYMGGDRPVYFFRSRGFEAGERIETTIEDIVADYLREIGKIQPEGAYTFIGESGGGLVAYEMARQLQLQGKKVALVALMDTYLAEMSGHTAPPPIDPGNLIRKHLQTISSGGIMSLIQYYPGLWRYKFSEWRQARKKQAMLSRLGVKSEVYNRVEQANIVAGLAYRPQPFDGLVVMFSAARQFAFEEGKPDHGWRDAGARNLIVHVMDCHHGNILFEPFVQQVAGKLRQYLNNSSDQA